MTYAILENVTVLTNLDEGASAHHSLYQFQDSVGDLGVGVHKSIQ